MGIGTKRFGASVQDFSSAIRYHPQFADSYLNRGIAYTKLGRYGDANRDFTSALQLKPDSPAIYYGRAQAYFSNQEFKAAWDDAVKAERLGYPVEPAFMEELRMMTKSVSGNVR